MKALCLSPASLALSNAYSYWFVVCNSSFMTSTRPVYIKLFELSLNFYLKILLALFYSKPENYSHCADFLNFRFGFYNFFCFYTVQLKFLIYSIFIF